MAHNSLTCVIIDDDREIEKALSIRETVFVIEQDVPEDLERDSLDPIAIHALCAIDGEPVATGRLVKTADGWKIGRVAVLSPNRGKGTGRAVVELLLDKARQEGGGTVMASVQRHVIGFYEKLGFTAIGEPYMEAGIEHVLMVR